MLHNMTGYMSLAFYYPQQLSVVLTVQHETFHASISINSSVLVSPKKKKRERKKNSSGLVVATTASKIKNSNSYSILCFSPAPCHCILGDIPTSIKSL